MATKHRSVIGLVPAAGQARRLGGIDTSKEVLAVGHEKDGSPRPLTAHLLERFRLGGVKRSIVVLRSGKWDVPATLGSGARWGVDLGYLIVQPTPSVPHTLDAAYSWVHGHTVALGFPDIVFDPEDAYAHCLQRLHEGGSEVVLGLFPTDRPDKTDMVEVDENGRPVGLVIKDPDCGLRLTWSIAVWRPEFTDYLHRWLRGEATAREGTEEAYVGDVLNDAIADDLAIDAVTFEEGSYLDVATPQDLELARSLFASPCGA